jgi:hypothetical protein
LQESCHLSVFEPGILLISQISDRKEISAPKRAKIGCSPTLHGRAESRFAFLSTVPLQGVMGEAVDYFRC